MWLFLSCGTLGSTHADQAKQQRHGQVGRKRSCYLRGASENQEGSLSESVGSHICSAAACCNGQICSSLFSLSCLGLLWVVFTCSSLHLGVPCSLAYCLLGMFLKILHSLFLPLSAFSTRIVSLVVEKRGSLAVINMFDALDVLDLPRSL